MCVALDFPVVAAIRNEDFRRFGSRIGFRLIEVTPELNLDEAREVHNELQKIVNDLQEADWFASMPSPLPQEGLTGDAEAVLAKKI